MTARLTPSASNGDCWRATYPSRPKYFANHAIRLAMMSSVAQDIGPSGFALLTAIAMTEDDQRYAGAAKYYDAQLMPILGISSKATMTAIRQRCVEASWLHYEPGHKGKASVYWVTIPERTQGLGPRVDAALGSDFEPNAYRNRDECRTKVGHYIPNTGTSPSPSPGADGTVLNGDITMASAMAVTIRFAELNPDSYRSPDTVKKIAERFAGFIRNRSKGAEELQTYYALTDLRQWRAEADAEKRLPVDAAPLKVIKFIENRRKAVPVRSNPKGPDPRVEAEKRRAEEADKDAAGPNEMKRLLKRKELAHA